MLDDASVELAGGVGRAVLQTMHVRSAKKGVKTTLRTNLELKVSELVGLSEEEVDVVLDVKHTPPVGTPTRHLHASEHGLPGVPLAGPLSHSSPTSGSNFSLPQPRGVAPRAMTYGIPEVPSPKVSCPSPVAFKAMARGTNPSAPGVTPFLGYSVKTSCTLQDQLPSLESSTVFREAAVATRWASL